MTRRVRDTSLGNAARARGRMAPGGRVWSERPMARAAVRRQPLFETETEEESYFVSVDSSGYSSATPGTSHGWVMQWDSVDLGGQQPAEGWYDITFHLPMTGVHPTATTITIDVTTYMWPYGDASMETYYLTGGPFTVGQVLTFTILGFIDPDYWNQISFERVATSGDVEWTTDLANTFMTVEPAAAPVVVDRDSRPPNLKGGSHG